MDVFVVAPLLLVLLLSPANAFSQVVSDSEVIQITAIREELSRFAPGKFTAPRAFCVGVNAHVGSPSAEFLSALSTAYQKLVPLGSCKTECPNQDGEALQYPRPPLLECGYITAGDVWFEPEGQANLTVTFTAGPLWGRTGVYKLRRVSTEWKIIGYEPGTIS